VDWRDPDELTAALAEANAYRAYSLILKWSRRTTERRCGYADAARRRDCRRGNFHPTLPPPQSKIFGTADTIAINQAVIGV
jgi:hypothetical protein